MYVKMHDYVAMTKGTLTTPDGSRQHKPFSANMHGVGNGSMCVWAEARALCVAVLIMNVQFKQIVEPYCGPREPALWLSHAVALACTHIMCARAAL